MKIAALTAAALSVTCAVAAAAPQAQGARPNVGEAYAQFLIGHRLAESGDEAGAIAAYKRAMELDPTSADIPAELAGLYLDQNKAQESMSAAEQALKIDPANAEANRVLGIVYAALSDTGGGGRGQPRQPRQVVEPTDFINKAIEHLERAIAKPAGMPDPNVRATLSRLYVRSGSYDKAIKILAELVDQEPGWGEGPLLLAEAYAGAGRTDEAIRQLEARAAENPRLLPTLGEYYERANRWSDAAASYEKALTLQTRNNTDLKMSYAGALLRAGGRENAVKARDTLNGIVSAGKPGDVNVRAIYLLSQAQRRAGDPAGAEATARKVIAENKATPWGYYALAEALESRRAFQAIVDELTPVVAQHRGKNDPAFDIGLLLPHLGYAHQELGQYDKAIATFEEARKLSPDEPSLEVYVIEAQMAAKKYPAAADAAKAALARHPGDVRLSRLQAQALRRSGKADQGAAVLESALKQHQDDPFAYIALAGFYTDVERGPQALKVLQDAQAKFPQDTSIAFELGAVLDKQKKFADAEAAFRQVLNREPNNAAALNYLGYMLAERGERLDESVGYLKKALQMEPDNGSYLDSLGWAYFKSDKLDLAEENLRRAAEQLRTNSVIQDHYGDVLFKLGRMDDAIAAWTRALAGDGDSIDKGDIDKKIKSAKQKLPKK